MEITKANNTKQAFRTTSLLSSAVILLLCCLAGQAAEMRSRFAKFGDNKIHYQVSGKGEEALIFIHGWTCNGDFWRGQVGAFPALRVITVDLPGHGQSDKPHVAYTMDYFARSIEAVMRDAKVKRAVLVGHSMGTPVIRQFYRLYPEKTLGLVIVDGGLRLFIPKEQMEKLITGFRANYQVVGPQMIDGLLTPVKDAKLKNEIRTAMLSTPDYVAISAMEGMADEKIYAPDAIKVPVLAVLAKSPFWPEDTESFLRSVAPQLEFHMWEDVSHFLMMERPEEFNGTLQAFLAKNALLKK
ncbi:MAG TPA: alpha/beta hydrolase [Pyrinomonadaceae bacterium]|nr:alpha/beta hydrolase [Pyrinomonadaceae bacterium]